MAPSDSHQQGSGASNASPAAQKPPGSDVKPRLTKEQHDILEHHFQQQHKPSTSVKKEYALSLGVPLDKINVSTPAHARPPVILTACRTGSRTAGPRSSRTARR